MLRRYGAVAVWLLLASCSVADDVSCASVSVSVCERACVCVSLCWRVWERAVKADRSLW